MAQITAIRGMNDILPTQTPVWQYLENTVKNLLASYGYAEIRMPIVENTSLFKRSIGEVTDIVEKEMYTFDDRNGDSLTLRPEGTASCVRACEEHSLIANAAQQRLWYAGPMFRHERPQKGRYRQFHQIGVETFGMQGPDIDAELIIMTHQLWCALGIRNAVTLQINTLANAESRQQYKDALVAFLSQHTDKLDEDSQRRLHTNPLRILDSKDQNTQALLNAAPAFDAFIDAESREHFARLRALLDAAGVSYEVNPRLVRGLDYYGKTVFEWVTSELGSQGTVCAGGRYDGLVEQLGGKPTPAVGFAMGVERLILLLETLNAIPAAVTQTVDVFMAVAGNVESNAITLANALRGKVPGLRLLMNCGQGSFKSQMKKADKCGAAFALILGENEAEQGVVAIKHLRDEAEQITLPQNEVAGWLMQQLNKK